MRTTAKLILAILFLTALGTAVAADQKYPPYPDVWDWVAPKGLENIGLRLQRLSDGDVQVVYEDRRQLRDNHRPVFSTRFFDQQSVQRQVLPISNSLIARQQSYNATIKNGLTVNGAMGPGLRSNGCYDRLGGGVSVTDQQGRAVATRLLLYMFDRPRVWRVSAPCKGMDTPDEFSYQVESIFAEVLPLEDGTFLAADSVHGLVIRFDTDLQTKSKLINHRVFVVEPNFVEKVKEGSQKHADVTDYAELHKALYRKLSTFTREK